MQVLDLFSGIGGFSLGLERAGMKTVAFCEIDKKARQVLRKHWPDVPIFEDVTKLTGEVLRERGISVDVICGGFPCQDISVAGKGAGIEGERSGLWSEFARLISELRPQYAIVENVSALLNRGLDRVLGDLSEIGYDAEWNCIPASAVGAPHRRDRIWIVAYPCDEGIRSRRRGDGSKFDWQNSIGSDFEGRGRTDAFAAETGEPPHLEETLAYAEREGDGGRGIQRPDENREAVGEGQAEEFVGSSEAVAHADNQRSQGRVYWWAHQEQQSEHGYFGRCGAMDGQPIENWWAVEPAVGRVAHGISGRVDRLKQLGNAVVPQIPELIGKALMTW